MRPQWSLKKKVLLDQIQLYKKKSTKREYYLIKPSYKAKAEYYLIKLYTLEKKYYLIKPSFIVEKKRKNGVLLDKAQLQGQNRVLLNEALIQSKLNTT